MPMPEWLSNEWLPNLPSGVDATVPTLAMRLAIAWLCGWIIAKIACNHRPAEAADTLSLTLVLMSILIAMATQIIGDNIARAFSLVGALSIVRFRTAVPETRDVAFVLAAVVVGMAVGAGQYWVCGIGLITVGLAAQFYADRTIFKSMQSRSTSDIEGSSGASTLHPSSSSGSNDEWRLILKVGLHTVGGWEAELSQLTHHFRLVSAETARRGGALELVYYYQPRQGIDARQVVSTLNAVPNVESASAKPLHG